MIRLKGKMDLGSIAAFLQYTRSFSRPVSMMSQQFNSILNALAGAERIFKVIDEPAETDDGNVTLVNAVETSPAADAAYALTSTLSGLAISGDITAGYIDSGRIESDDISSI